MAEKCPFCNSDNVGESKKPAGVVGLLLLLIGVPLPLYKREFHCFDCYKDFKVENQADGVEVRE